MKLSIITINRNNADGLQKRSKVWIVKTSPILSNNY